MRQRAQAPEIIIALLSGAPGNTMTTRQLLRSTDILAVPANRARVAASRLVARGVLSSPRRGVYALGPKAPTAGTASRDWQAHVQRLQPVWDGSWVMAWLPPGDMPPRAGRFLERSGFQRASPRLHVRPSNLRGGLEALRHRATAPLQFFLATDLDAVMREAVCGLWDTDALARRYASMRSAIHEMSASWPSAPDDTRLREAFWLGHWVTGQLGKDPLLPSEMVEAQHRDALFTSYPAFDRMVFSDWLAAISD